MPAYMPGLGAPSHRSGPMGPGVLIGSTSPAPAPAPAPVATAPVSASAAYYYDPEEDARRIAEIQARIQAGIAAERAAARARSQRRSRPSASSSTEQTQPQRPPRYMQASAPQDGMMMDPGVVMVTPEGTPEQFADSSGMADYYSGHSPQAYASTSGMVYPAAIPQTAPAAYSQDQALIDNGGVSDQWYTPEYPDPAPAPAPRPAPQLVVTPEQAVAASEGMMQPVYMAPADRTNPGQPASPAPQMPGSALVDTIYGALARLFRTPVPSAYDAAKRAYGIQ